MTCLFAIWSRDFNEVESLLKNQYVLLNKHSIKATANLEVAINLSLWYTSINASDVQEYLTQ